MPVEMGLRRIIISEIHEQQVIVLKELEGDRSFSIQIGILKLQVLIAKLKRFHRPDLLPMTYYAKQSQTLGRTSRNPN